MFQEVFLTGCSAFEYRMGRLDEQHPAFVKDGDQAVRPSPQKGLLGTMGFRDLKPKKP